MQVWAWALAFCKLVLSSEAGRGTCSYLCHCPFPVCTWGLGGRMGEGRVLFKIGVFEQNDVRQPFGF